MTPDFKKAMVFTMKWEGGSAVTNHPNDKGGLTKYGLSEKANPDLDIVNLTYDQAEVVYYTRYWLPSGADSIPYPANIALFDSYVNHRPKTAIRLLQRAAGVLDDGIFGPQTLSAVQSMDPYLLAIAMVTEREKYFRAIVENDPTQAVFLRGWLNRAAALMEFVRKTS